MANNFIALYSYMTLAWYSLFEIKNEWNLHSSMLLLFIYLEILKFGHRLGDLKYYIQSVNIYVALPSYDAMLLFRIMALWHYSEVTLLSC